MSGLESIALRRSSLATIEVVGAFCAAHAAAGGQLPDLHWLLLAVAAVFPASWLVIRRRFSMRWMVPALTIAQLWLHLATSAVPASGHAGHLHTHGDQPVLTWPMLGAHLLSAGVTALIWSLRRRLWRMLSSRPATIRPLPIVARVAVMSTRAVVDDLLWARGGPRRGPPAVPLPAC